MKRAASDVISATKGAKIIMLDIEGTTTSISFVKEELFPYVRREVESYLQDTWDDPQTQQDVKDLIEQIDKDVENGVQGMAACPGADAPRSEVISALVSGVHAMMDADRKVGPLKALQGHMWRRAYADGTVKGHVYEDVLDALKEWKGEGKDIVIYSSGSVEAQKLLFVSDTPASDYIDIIKTSFKTLSNIIATAFHITKSRKLDSRNHLNYKRFSAWRNVTLTLNDTPKGRFLRLYFSHHFDTGVGAKVEAQSYKNILKELKCDLKDVVFLTDLPKEAWAAKEAGMEVVLSVREGTAPLSTEDLATFPQVTSFSQLLDRPSSPRKKKTSTEKQAEASQK
ncbi:enolase-phosphatase E1-like [Macrobrachium nipponense]|uniref:enolase-phosphatase E1-like n=1 Tax=Macrobrachium nipponense TaxID=159736 RepID=UPI0030C7C702